MRRMFLGGPESQKTPETSNDPFKFNNIDPLSHKISDPSHIDQEIEDSVQYAQNLIDTGQIKMKIPDFTEPLIPSLVHPFYGDVKKKEDPFKIYLYENPIHPDSSDKPDKISINSNQIKKFTSKQSPENTPIPAINRIFSQKSFETNSKFLIAVETGSASVVKKILAHTLENHASVFSLVSNHLGPSKSTPLMLAASKGHLSVAIELLKAGAPVDSVDSENETALLKASYLGNLDIVKLLLSYSADPTLSDKDGWTSLHNAASCNHLDLVKLLVGIENVNINAQSLQGHTPLMNAASRGNTLIVDFLLKTGRVKVDLKNNFGENAYDIGAAGMFVDLCSLIEDAERLNWLEKQATSLVTETWDPIKAHTSNLIVIYENERSKGYCIKYTQDPHISTFSSVSAAIYNPISSFLGFKSNDDVHPDNKHLYNSSNNSGRLIYPKNFSAFNLIPNFDPPRWSNVKSEPCTPDQVTLPHLGDSSDVSNAWFWLTDWCFLSQSSQPIAPNCDAQHIIDPDGWKYCKYGFNYANGNWKDSLDQLYSSPSQTNPSDISCVRRRRWARIMRRQIDPSKFSHPFDAHSIKKNTNNSYNELLNKSRESFLSLKTTEDESRSDAISLNAKSINEPFIYTNSKGIDENHFISSYKDLESPELIPKDILHDQTSISNFNLPQDTYCLNTSIQTAGDIPNTIEDGNDFITTREYKITQQSNLTNYRNENDVDHGINDSISDDPQSLSAGGDASMNQGQSVEISQSKVNHSKSSSPHQPLDPAALLPKDVKPSTLVIKTNIESKNPLPSNDFNISQSLSRNLKNIETEYKNSLRTFSSIVYNRQYMPEQVWQPDSTTSNCINCGRKFKLFFRRHHCRRCGLVYCDICTKGREWLASRLYSIENFDLRNNIPLISSAKSLYGVLYIEELMKSILPTMIDSDNLDSDINQNGNSNSNECVPSEIDADKLLKPFELSVSRSGPQSLYLVQNHRICIPCNEIIQKVEGGDHHGHKNGFPTVLSKIFGLQLAMKTNELDFSHGTKIFSNDLLVAIRDNDANKGISETLNDTILDKEFESLLNSSGIILEVPLPFNEDPALMLVKMNLPMALQHSVPEADWVPSAVDQYIKIIHAIQTQYNNYKFQSSKALNSNIEISNNVNGAKSTKINFEGNKGFDQVDDLNSGKSTSDFGNDKKNISEIRSSTEIADNRDYSASPPRFSSSYPSASQKQKIIEPKIAEMMNLPLGLVSISNARGSVTDPIVVLKPSLSLIQSLYKKMDDIGIKSVIRLGGNENHNFGNKFKNYKLTETAVECPVCNKLWADILDTVGRSPGEGWQEIQERHIKECLVDMQVEVSGTSKARVSTNGGVGAELDRSRDAVDNQDRSSDAAAIYNSENIRYDSRGILNIENNQYEDESPVGRFDSYDVPNNSAFAEIGKSRSSTEINQTEIQLENSGLKNLIQDESGSFTVQFDGKNQGKLITSSAEPANIVVENSLALEEANAPSSSKTNNMSGGYTKKDHDSNDIKYIIGRNINEDGSKIMVGGSFKGDNNLGIENSGHREFSKSHTPDSTVKAGSSEVTGENSLKSMTLNLINQIGNITGVIGLISPPERELDPSSSAGRDGGMASSGRKYYGSSFGVSTGASSSGRTRADRSNSESSHENRTGFFNKLIFQNHSSARETHESNPYLVGALSEGHAREGGSNSNMIAGLDHGSVYSGGVARSSGLLGSHTSSSAVVKPKVRFVSYKLSEDSPLLGQECSICFEEFECGDSVARLSCFCTFHSSCIKEWFSRNPNCPVHGV
ncbi:Ankyrin repeat and SAM domain-containing protein 3 [Smittium mucronatum]|uniref:Ankyrin repeat and SAM domain-containing protein 3 n=1 Tax=Smittium mucronatum TaxID=133383 RepID=A0A1R0GT63_9FUNG|nr:Ankyrin repeat and SAM domain-containing protein 3 [Smittium mucronatum]